MTNQLADAAMPGAILLQTHFFQGLTPGQIDRLAAVSEMRQFQGGQQVYRIGESAKAIYVLVDGTVRMAIGFGGRDSSVPGLLRSPCR